MKKRGKIAQRTLVAILLVIFVLIASLSVTVGLQVKNALLKSINHSALSYVRGAAEYIDGDTVKNYCTTGSKDEYYNEIENYLNSTANSTIDSVDNKNISIKYLYVFVPNEDNYTYIWDAEPEQEPEEFLSQYSYSEGAKEQAFKLIEREITEDSQYYVDSEDGQHILTVSVPLCDSNDKGVAIIAADISVDIINDTVNNTVFSVIGIIAALMLVIMFVYYYTTRKKIVQPIIELQKATENIVENIENDSDLKIDITTNDEIELLADSIVEMDSKLRDYIKQNAAITAEKERIGAELELATRIQADMLPNIFPAFPERKDFDIFASMTPAKEVGGDFYDFFLVDDTHLAIVMADVSGKGVPAALFMMMSKILIQEAAMSGKSPAEALESVNNQICANNREEMFVTVWLGILDLESGILTAANAGHEKPIIKQPNCDFEFFTDRHGFVIGGMSGIKYKNYEIALEKGAKLFIYTDGVAEATSEADELFGIERTVEALNLVKDKTPEIILESVKKSVDEFVGNAPQFDDLTMLCFEYVGADNGNSNELTLDATLENVSKAVDFVNEKMDKLPLSTKDKHQIDISVDEIVSNVARYAYEGNDGKVTVKTVSDKSSLTITVIDSGIPYNPLKKEDPDVTLSADERGIGGYGIFIVKKVMDDVSYEYKDGKNILTMKKIF